MLMIDNVVTVDNIHTHLFVDLLCALVVSEQQVGDTQIVLQADVVWKDLDQPLQSRQRPSNPT